MTERYFPIAETIKLLKLTFKALVVPRDRVRAMLVGKEEIVNKNAMTVSGVMTALPNVDTVQMMSATKSVRIFCYLFS